MLPESEAKDDTQLKEFAEKNEFCGQFRASAKTGVNINESMEYLIREIIKRMESFASQGNDVFTSDRKSVVLDTKKHTDSQVAKGKKKDNDCC